MSAVGTQVFVLGGDSPSSSGEDDNSVVHVPRDECVVSKFLSISKLKFDVCFYIQSISSILNNRTNVGIFGERRGIKGVRCMEDL